MRDVDDEDVAQLRMGMERLQNRLLKPKQKSSAQSKAGKFKSPKPKPAAKTSSTTAGKAKSTKPKTIPNKGSALPASVGRRKKATKKADPFNDASKSQNSFASRVQTAERHRGLVSQLETVTRDLKLLSSGMDNSEAGIEDARECDKFQGIPGIDAAELDSFLRGRRKESSSWVEAGRRLMDDDSDDDDADYCDDEIHHLLYSPFEDLLLPDEGQGTPLPMTPDPSDQGAPPSGHSFRRRDRRVGSTPGSPGTRGSRPRSPGRHRFWRTPPVKPRGDMWGCSASVASSKSGRSAAAAAAAASAAKQQPYHRSPFTPKQFTDGRIPWIDERALDTSLEEEFFDSVLAQSAARVRQVTAGLKAL